MKYGTVNSLQSPRFAGVKTFMRMQNIRTLDDIDFAVLGIPFDTCATYRAGARFGPASIREMSSLAAKPYHPELEVDIFAQCSGVDYGDIGSVPGYVEESFDVMQKEMKEIFARGIIPIAMGGDHSVTLPELRACSEVYGPVALVHFDAHYDTISEYFGKPYSHGTPFYHAAMEGLVDTAHSIQLGIREGLYGAEDAENSAKLGYQSITAAQMHEMSGEDVIRCICARTEGKKVFLTFDIDFLDPAFAPGTGTPVPGGFSTWEALKILRGLKELDIVGYDIVEVAPAFDGSGITSIAAAGIIQEFMSLIAWRKKHGKL
ncbi:agmatinase [Butyricicoccus porcorum]|uniref:Agmatinase n=2 Tax=Butyricicoccus porcorum TaxID=1945634 RepID=A0A252F3G4_9FIRM|nr:agmatinase [Butyricicoccus porcorum]MDD6986475.1 agmatinase [Butyricicoccus porcorum]OUM20272.1 agmatinase [Butyricicoccus porcorum]